MAQLNITYNKQTRKWIATNDAGETREFGDRQSAIHFCAQSNSAKADIDESAKIRQKSEYESSGSVMTASKIPRQMDNKNYGKKRRAKTHTYPIKNSATGQAYGYKTIAENDLMHYLDRVLVEKEKIDDTRLPASVVGEIASLIKKGAKDLQQAWKNAFELVHTAYHVANVRRPIPSEKGAWAQYEELLGVGVKALADTRGITANWRSSKPAFAESVTNDLDRALNEAVHNKQRKHRIFVRAQQIGFDDGVDEYEVNANSLDEVIHPIIHQARRNGKHVRVEPISRNQINLIVYIRGATKMQDDMIIKLKDWSV